MEPIEELPYFYKVGPGCPIALGISQGAEQKAIETAKNFLQMNHFLEQVAPGTGLSLETVEQLAKELGDLKVYSL